VFAFLVLIIAIGAALFTYFRIIDNTVTLIICISTAVLLSLIAVLVIFANKKVMLWVKFVPILALLASGGMLAFILLESDDSKIERRLDTFVTAANHGNLEGMINCFDPVTSNSLMAANRLMGGCIGRAIENTFSISLNTIDVFAITVGGVAILGYYDRHFDIIVDSIEFTNYANTRATASIRVTAQGYESRQSLYMIKSGLDWHIDGAGILASLIN